MNINVGTWLKILRLGTDRQLSPSFLNNIVANFNSEDQVPIIVGELTIDAPAFGWISELRKTGDALYGKIGHLHNTLYHDLRLGKYNSIVARITDTKAGQKLLNISFSEGQILHPSGINKLTFGGITSYEVQFNLSGIDCHALSCDLMATLAYKV